MGHPQIDFVTRNVMWTFREGGILVVTLKNINRPFPECSKKQKIMVVVVTTLLDEWECIQNTFTLVKKLDYLSNA